MEGFWGFMFTPEAREIDKEDERMERAENEVIRRNSCCDQIDKMVKKYNKQTKIGLPFETCWELIMFRNYHEKEGDEFIKKWAEFSEDKKKNLVNSGKDIFEYLTGRSYYPKKKSLPRSCKESGGGDNQLSRSEKNKNLEVTAQNLRRAAFDNLENLSGSNCRERIKKGVKYLVAADVIDGLRRKR
jgi:hypothetical protein